ncbi:uncharacterized protein LOC134208993 [Armigeres subalbatus]|uniref:uncharacterized protein LOC134208993 n=1 Tax=Armigeres subalbatus TaxID=124917 RepID=UPI002ED65ECD
MSERELAIGKLKQRLASLLESVGLLEMFLKKYKPEEHEGQVQVRLAKLEEFFNVFFDVAAQLESYSSKEEAVSTKEERYLFESKYYSLKVALQSKLPKPSTSAAPVPSSVAVSHIRYPEIPLLKFSGRPEDWVSFRDSFKAGVANRKEISDVEKLQYLKRLVQGDAARIIGHIEISDEGYRTAWKLLGRRYENKRRLIFCHLEALYDTAAMRKESCEELLRVIDSFEEHLSNLKRLGEPTDRWSSSLVYHLYIRLDPNTKREWDRYCNAVDDGWQFHEGRR